MMSAMDLITISSAVVLLCLVVFFVALPLLASRRRLSRHASGTRVRQLTEQKEQFYATIKELEFDCELGKLLEPDYRRLRAEVEQQALDVLRILDQLNGGASQNEVREHLEKEILDRRVAAAPVCPSCAITLRPDDLFCSQCGARLAPQPD